MSARAEILKTLIATPNVAAERAIEAALHAATGREQAELADVVLERNRRGGWVALIRTFHRLDPAIQDKILSRPRDLFGPLAESMHEMEGPSRENVINIVQRCTDVRLTFLLAESLVDARAEVRTLAGESLLQAVRRHWTTSHTPAAEPPPPEEYDQLRKAIELGLRNFKTHRQTAALTAAMIHERQQDAHLWLLFADPYDDRTRAATIILRAPPEPALATAVVLGLGSSLKPAAMAGLAAIETPAIAEALAQESYRLLDPILREPAQGVGHLKLLPALRKSPPWNLTNWMSWLRIIELVGLQPAERLHWLSRMLEAAPATADACAWKIHVARALADTGLSEAGIPLGALTRDGDERVARCAGRFLLSRRHADWRERAIQTLPASPHASVRRLVAFTRSIRESEATSAAPARTVSARGFEKAWNDYQKMPPVIQHNTARTVAADPAFADQLRAKMQGGVTDVAQGLKMIAALPSLTPYRHQIIAACGHPDPRVAAIAVRMVGRLEDPRLKELLEAAAHHPDARVRANAVESMEQLHIADRSQQVLHMLNSRHNRERANAIKALGQFNFSQARECLQRMLTDTNPLHRISALWVVEQFNLTEIMRQVSVIARRDPNLRVRRRAIEMLESLSGSIAAHT